MKKFSKLKLNKKTVSSLNDVEMSMMKGGTGYCGSGYVSCDQGQVTCTGGTCAWDNSCNTCDCGTGGGGGTITQGSDYQQSCPANCGGTTDCTANESLYSVGADQCCQA